jgi:LysM repeat protein
MKTSLGTGTDMARGVAIAMVITLACAALSANADDYHLYRPEKVQSKNIPPPGDGVLTRTIVIRKGDTLSRLSRRYGGRSSFFPQILLFNSIKNPDLIYAGDLLRIPVTGQDMSPGQIGGGSPSTVKGGAALGKRRTLSAPAASGRAGQHLFKRGVRAFDKGNYTLALDIFDDYQTAYPNSPDAPEAALYKADCYMKLSGR